MTFLEALIIGPFPLFVGSVVSSALAPIVGAIGWKRDVALWIALPVAIAATLTIMFWSDPYVTPKQVLVGLWLAISFGGLLAIIAASICWLLFFLGDAMVPDDESIVRKLMIYAAFVLSLLIATGAIWIVGNFPPPDDDPLFKTEPRGVGPFEY